jgi:hypothetical protein
MISVLAVLDYIRGSFISQEYKTYLPSPWKRILISMIERTRPAPVERRAPLANPIPGGGTKCAPPG